MPPKCDAAAAKKRPTGKKKPSITHNQKNTPEGSKKGGKVSSQQQTTYRQVFKNNNRNNASKNSAAYITAKRLALQQNFFAKSKAIASACVPLISQFSALTNNASAPATSTVAKGKDDASRRQENERKRKRDNAPDGSGAPTDGKPALTLKDEEFYVRLWSSALHDPYEGLGHRSSQNARRKTEEADNSTIHEERPPRPSLHRSLAELEVFCKTRILNELLLCREFSSWASDASRLLLNTLEADMMRSDSGNNRYFTEAGRTTVLSLFDII